MITHNKGAKLVVETTVRDYVKLCPDEFDLFKQAMREKQSDAPSAYAEVEGTDYIVRKLFEVPETLLAMLKVKMNDEEFEWFRSKEGSRWFAKKFRQFRSSEKS